MRLPLLLLALCACAGSRALCPREGGSAWYRVTTDHFEISTNLDKDDAVEAALEVEDTRAALAATPFFKAAAPGAKRRVVLLRRASQLQEFMPKAAGFTGGTPDGPIVVSVAEPSTLIGPQRVRSNYVAHEIVHQLAATTLRREPHWFAEALATYLETVYVDSRAGVAEFGGENPDMFRAVALGLSPPARLWEWDGSTEVEDALQIYATCWFLMFHLENAHPEVVADFARRLATGEEPKTAWVHARGSLSEERLYDELYQRYADGGSVQVFQQPFEPSSGRNSVAPLPDAEVHVLRAWMLGSERELADAKEALAHDPHDLAARLLWLDIGPNVDRRAEATSLVHDFPNDGRAQFAYARAVGLDSADGEAALRKAAELDPTYAPARGQLAELLMQKQKRAEAEAHARAAVSLEPTDPAYRNTLARALAETGRCAEALEHQQRALEGLSESSSKQTRLYIAERLAKLQAQCKQP